MNDFWDARTGFSYSVGEPTYGQDTRGRTPSSTGDQTISPKTSTSHVFPLSQHDDDEMAGSPMAGSPTASWCSSAGSVMTPSSDEQETDLFGITDMSPHEGPSESVLPILERGYSQQSGSSTESLLFHRGSQGSVHSTSPTYHMQPQFVAQTPAHQEPFNAYQTSEWAVPVQQQLTIPPGPSVHMSPSAFSQNVQPPWSHHRLTSAGSSSTLWEMDSDPKKYGPANPTVYWAINYANHTMYNTQTSQYPPTNDPTIIDPTDPISGSDLTLPNSAVSLVNRTLDHSGGYYSNLHDQRDYHQYTATSQVDYCQALGNAETASNPGSSAFSDMVSTMHATDVAIDDNFIEEPQSFVNRQVRGSPVAETNKSKKSKAKNGHGIRKNNGPTQRAGGRKLGTHLESTKAAEANIMRKIGVCWRCKLQRDKCDPGETCRRCINRSSKPGDDWSFGCCREKVTSLVPFFLPVWVSSLHAEPALTKLCNEHVFDWTLNEFKIMLTPGFGLPWLEVEVYEFTPKNKELLRQFQYFKDPTTGKNIRREKTSPPLGLQWINYEKGESKYDTHVKQIATQFMSNFVGRFYAGEKENFSKRMFECLVNINPESGTHQEELLTDVYYLIITTYIVAHTLTIPDEHKTASLTKLTNYGQTLYGDKTSPRLANRQIKHFYARLQERRLKSLMSRLQTILHSSKGCDKWTEAFIIVLGLAIAAEVIQKNINSILDSRVSQGEIELEDAVRHANHSVHEIDSYFEFVMELFQKKYARSCNPIKDCNNNWSEKITQPGMLTCLRSLGALVREKRVFLETRMQAPVSYDGWRQYTSRLTAKFLLSFLKSGY